MARKRGNGFLMVLVLGWILSACTIASWRSYDASLNPPKGFPQAQTECRMKAKTVSGYDWIDAALRRSDTFDYCMYKYGYRRERDKS